MKVVLSVAEDVPSPSVLLPDRRYEDVTYGRHVANRSFLAAIAKHGQLDYLLCPSGVRTFEDANELGTLIGIPTVPSREILKILGSERVLMHEVGRHRLNRLSVLRSLYARSPVAISAQAHGLAFSGLVEEFCLLLLSSVMSGDTIVCPSRSSMHVLNAALLDSESVIGATRRGVRKPHLAHIPLGVDADLFAPVDRQEARARFGIDPDRFVFMSFGRLSPLDKADLTPILRAFQEVVLRAPSDKKSMLVVAGKWNDSRYQEYVRGVIAEAGLGDSVSMIQVVQDDDRPALYSLADVFLAVSDTINESFGLTLIESLCCGTPVIAADWNGYRESVIHGLNGLVVPVIWSSEIEDIQIDGLIMPHYASLLARAQSVVIEVPALAGAMMRCVMADPAWLRELSHNCVRTRHLYSWNDVIGKYEQLWLDIGISRSRLHRRQHLPVSRRLKLFRTYPSRHLGPADTLSLTEFGNERYSQGKQPFGFKELSGFLSSIETIDLIVNSIRQSHGSARVEDVVRASGNLSASVVMWHLLWLIKHNYLAVARTTGESWSAVSPDAVLIGEE